ncbi:hypothetical protein [Vulcanisaeta souniana]|uniref:Uncharacterized protein n=1 Tax=Vulcanisaeta souniana JCM 11219 TaxID=1293586 RepID=A0A830E186_9CREN|nr:hypothetical protein [Vulcanisaeta souniana]BDR91367.1 hypothetical protein Vsou_04600 [Vulcanisaeta souniana JCM 11219]GGI72636.1 hypothetical protein GCM10007112_06820 [Vulcanisaeta souniana JCM 11219]
MEPQRDIGTVLSSVPHYSLNPYISKCPSCGSVMAIDGEWIREDSRHRVKLVERSLSCPHCKVKIRQYVYLQ